MVIDAAGERRQQGRFRNQAAGSSNAVFDAMAPPTQRSRRVVTIKSPRAADIPY
jgi:hypothetical protein